jgi:hypothetical protein
MLRLTEHIEWAAQHGALDLVARFLRELREEDLVPSSPRIDQSLLGALSGTDSSGSDTDSKPKMSIVHSEFSASATLPRRLEKSFTGGEHRPRVCRRICRYIVLLKEIVLYFNML